MPNLLPRIVAFLLVPCLIADPSAASAFTKPFVAQMASSVVSSRLNDQALVSMNLTARFPFVRRGAPYLASAGVLFLVGIDIRRSSGAAPTNESLHQLTLSVSEKLEKYRTKHWVDVRWFLRGQKRIGYWFNRKDFKQFTRQIAEEQNVPLPMDWQGFGENIWKRLVLAPDEVIAKAQSVFEAQEYLLKDLPVVQDFKEILPGTLLNIDLLKAWTDWESSPEAPPKELWVALTTIDDARRIPDTKGEWNHPGEEIHPLFKAHVDWYIEKPVQALARRVEEIGGTPLFSNAYGPNNWKGLVWKKEGVLYYTPLTVKAYDKNLIATETLYPEGEIPEQIPANLYIKSGTFSSAVLARSSPPQMGKRAIVKQIEERDGRKFLKVYAADPSNLFLGDLELDEKPNDLIRKSLKRLSQDYYGKALLFHVAQLSKKLQPDLYTFSKMVLDLGGYASAANGLIAIHELLVKLPVALFHEFCEYLIQSKWLTLSLHGTRLVITLDGTIYKVNLNPESISIANVDPGNPHYLLRALQRQLFGVYDLSLSFAITAIRAEAAAAATSSSSASFQLLGAA